MNIIELDEFDEIVNSVKREYKVQLEYKKKSRIGRDVVSIYELTSQIKVSEKYTIFLGWMLSYKDFDTGQTKPSFPLDGTRRLIIGIQEKDNWDLCEGIKFIASYRYDDNKTEEIVENLLEHIGISLCKESNHKLYIAPNAFRELVKWAEESYPQYEGDNAFEGCCWQHITDKYFLMLDWVDGYEEDEWEEDIKNGQIVGSEKEYRLELTIRIEGNQYFKNDNLFLDDGYVTFNKNDIEDSIRYLLECANIYKAKTKKQINEAIQYLSCF